ncbi:MAG: DUF3526 domain-containing protein [Acidobacteria bacterium]|nr:DUF3526 domain-containing protein [Acidobacteriota bacterium]
MLARIIRHEWQMLKADAVLWVIVAIVGSAIAYGVWNGTRWVHFQEGAIEAARSEERVRFDRLTAQLEKVAAGERVSPFADPRSPSNLGSRLAAKVAVLPPAPLGALTVGQSDLLPSYVRVSTESREAVLASTEVESPLRLLTGRFDLAFVVVYLVPLLVLALAYSMVSGEKEQGTLSMVLAQPVSLGTLVAAKVVVRAAALLVIIVGLGLGTLLMTGVSLADAATRERLLWWVASVAAYMGLWFAIALVGVSLGRGSAATATLLAGLWLLLVVIVPSALTLGVQQLYPVPSRVALVQATRVASDEANAQGARLLAAYYEDHPELATGDAEQAMTDFNVVRLAVNDDIEKRVRPVVAQFDEQLSSQQALVERFRVLSPALVVYEALSDLSGSGQQRHRHFVSQVSGFHDEWRRFFTQKVVAKTPVADLSSLPTFTYSEEPSSALRARMMATLATLLVPAVLLGGLAFIRLRRYAIAG